MDRRNSKTSMLNEIKRLEVKLTLVYEAGSDGIGFVGRANYQDRCDEANNRLEEAMWLEKADE